MEMLLQIVVMGFLVEAVWETLKMVWQEGKIQIDRIGALFVGLAIAITINIDIFVAVGLNPIFHFVGIIATGILISRGGNFVHDLFEKLNQ